MRPINIIHLRVFCNPEEDKEKIKKAFLSLLGYDASELDAEKIKAGGCRASLVLTEPKSGTKVSPW